MDRINLYFRLITTNRVSSSSKLQFSIERICLLSILRDRDSPGQRIETAFQWRSRSTATNFSSSSCYILISFTNRYLQAEKTLNQATSNLSLEQQVTQEVVTKSQALPT